MPNDRTVVEDGYGEVQASKSGAVVHNPPAYRQSRNGISALFGQLEANKAKLGFEYYSVSQATLDQVFLSIVSKHNVVEENYSRQHTKKVSTFQRMKQWLAEKKYLLF